MQNYSCIPTNPPMPSNPYYNMFNPYQYMNYYGPYGKQQKVIQCPPCSQNGDCLRVCPERNGSGSEDSGSGSDTGTESEEETENKPNPLYCLRGPPGKDRDSGDSSGTAKPSKSSEGVGFCFTPSADLATEVTVTIEPEEPDVLDYALDNGIMPIICGYMPPSAAPVVPQMLSRHCYFPRFDPRQGLPAQPVASQHSSHHTVAADSRQYSYVSTSSATSYNQYNTASYYGQVQGSQSYQSSSSSSEQKALKPPPPSVISASMRQKSASNPGSIMSSKNSGRIRASQQIATPQQMVPLQTAENNNHRPEVNSVPKIIKVSQADLQMTAGQGKKSMVVPK